MIFKEETTSALAGFHEGSLFWSNWNLKMMVLVKGGKLESTCTEKNPRSKARTNTKHSPHMAPGDNQTQATLVRAEHPRHCTIPAPLYVQSVILNCLMHEIHLQLKFINLTARIILMIFRARVML